MWNPLKVPLAALGIVVDLARALGELPQMLAALESRLARRAEQDEAVLSELERLRGVVEALAEQVALALADIRTLRAQVADSAAVQDQLERTQAELAEANREIGRMIETAEPEPTRTPDPEPEPAETPEEPRPGRMGRFTSAFRRSSTA
jgi:chromosome segregation ATPase